MRVAPNVRGLASFCRNLLGHRSHRGRIEAPAQKDSGPIRAQAIHDSGLEKRLEILDIFLWLLVANPPVGRRRPVAPDLQTFRRDTQGMPGGQALNIAKARRGIVAIQSKQQKIPNRRFIEFAGYFRVHANAIQSVAEEKEIFPFQVIKRLDTEMIPRAKQLFMVRIPDGEGKITPEVLHRGRAPSGIGVQNQFGVWSVGLNDAAGAFELGD